jgi:hypothetical protein
MWTRCRLCLKAMLGASEDDDQVNSEVHSNAVIKQGWICTWRLWWSEFVDAHEGHDQLNLELHCEAVIEWLVRFTWKPRSGEFGDTLGGLDRVKPRMHTEAVIQRDSRCTCRLWTSQIGGIFGGGYSGGSRWKAHHVLRMDLLVCSLNTVWMWYGDYVIESCKTQLTGGSPSV